jgi:hypothetical protein
MKEAIRSVAVIRPRIIKRPCAAARLFSVMSRNSRAAAGFSSVSRSVAARGYRITETSSTASAEKLRSAARSRSKPSPLKQNSAICRRPSVSSLLMRTVPEMTLYQKPPLSPGRRSPDCAKSATGSQSPRARSARRADPSGRYPGCLNRCEIIAAHPPVVCTSRPPQPLPKARMASYRGLRNAELYLRDSTYVELRIS